MYIIIQWISLHLYIFLHTTSIATKYSTRLLCCTNNNPSKCTFGTKTITSGYCAVSKTGGNIGTKYINNVLLHCARCLHLRHRTCQQVIGSFTNRTIVTIQTCKWQFIKINIVECHWWGFAKLSQIQEVRSWLEIITACNNY